MDVVHFNHRPATKAKRPSEQVAMDRSTSLDSGVLDPGFEDFGISMPDVKLAPGVLGHFGIMSQPPLGYFGMPTLERV